MIKKNVLLLERNSADTKQDEQQDEDWCDVISIGGCALGLHLLSAKHNRSCIKKYPGSSKLYNGSEFLKPKKCIPPS